MKTKSRYGVATRSGKNTARSKAAKKKAAPKKKAAKKKASPRKSHETKTRRYAGSMARYGKVNKAQLKKSFIWTYQSKSITSKNKIKFEEKK